MGLPTLGPSACYLSRAGYEEAKILSRRRPIKEIVNDRTIDQTTRTKLKLVADARIYARSIIGLKTGESFTAYSQLDSDTLVLVLSAAYRDQLRPYTWWFPIVGRVPYKGFFELDDAQRAARDLEQEGLDTYLRTADAFSTLGFFNDPLLSTTLRRDTLDLANTVIHEVTHNTFYAKGQATFNESFASFVGARGAAAFFRSRGSEAAAQRVEARWADDKLLADFWTTLGARLDSAFAQHPDDRPRRLAVRDSLYTHARQLLIDSIAPRFQAIDPQYATRIHLDNASLLARRVYATDLHVFDAIWEREQRDLKRAIQRIITLARSNPSDPYKALHTWLSP